MEGRIAVLNAGSSSIKFALYEAGGGDQLFRGKVEGIGVNPRLNISDGQGETVAERSWPAAGFDHAAATHALLETAVELNRHVPVAGIGHRVVHGGTAYVDPVRVDAKVMTDLAALCPLAPLHQPHNLAAIQAIMDAAPQIPQVACFDTAFHRRQPHLAQLYALPREITDAGVRRYGFHGLSYEYVTQRLPEVAPELAKGRVVIAHLGNGASLCAVKDSRSVANTMGFTAVEGLMMGTRSGSLDPGVLIYLMDQYGMDARALEDLIYKRSGLLGVSGVSSDMRALRASHDPAAAEAVALFVYRIVREIGSMAAALGGVDGLIFTAGIGENDAAARAEIAAGCAWLGVELDAARNAAAAGRISGAGSKVSAWVVPTDEERMVARHTSAVLARER
ncbi:acetate/propionate family kinase [Caulobacter sp. 17J65-9]|uniref:acetate/propionate family kinase n=1 Tax=Caulobacter sp. 17J65-9 TaxID=2709382 RepID=UPI0013CC6AB4|nr:acetate/propionate family kinase [Caulobacter sp. 17J65-9]NEX92182.1 acetate/propionate family kinase [Caulobacter sp. 17J65-9]